MPTSSESPTLVAAPRHWDRARLLDDLEGDEALLEEIVTLLSGLIPNLRFALTSALDRSDAAGLARAAHRVAGALGNCGAPGIARLARDVEQQARQHLLAAAVAGARRLMAELDELARELAADVGDRRS